MNIHLPWESAVLNRSPWTLLAWMAVMALMLSLITWFRAKNGKRH